MRYLLNKENIESTKERIMTNTIPAVIMGWIKQFQKWLEFLKGSLEEILSVIFNLNNIAKKPFERSADQTDNFKYINMIPAN